MNVSLCFKINGRKSAGAIVCCAQSIKGIGFCCATVGSMKLCDTHNEIHAVFFSSKRNKILHCGTSLISGKQCASSAETAREVETLPKSNYKQNYTQSEERA